MKDLIAKLKSDACLAMGGIWLHIDAREARIAELETKLQEQDAMLGRRPCQDDRCVKMAELEAQIAASADTDKLREAIAGISNNAITDAWESCGGVGGFYKSFGYQQFAHAVLDLAADAVSSMALQAPVREVPGWKPIETAPKDGTMFIGWVRSTIYTDDAEGYSIQSDNSTADFCQWCNFETGGCFIAMAGPHGDSADWITHWMPLPAAPVQEPKP